MINQTKTKNIAVLYSYHFFLNLKCAESVQEGYDGDEDGYLLVK